MNQGATDTALSTEATHSLLTASSRRRLLDNRILFAVFMAGKAKSLAQHYLSLARTAGTPFSRSYYARLARDTWHVYLRDLRAALVTSPWAPVLKALAHFFFKSQPENTRHGRREASER